MSLSLVSQQLFETQQEGQLLTRQMADVEALEIHFDRVPNGLREELGASSIPPATH